MKAPPTSDDDVVLMLCGHVLALVRQVETLESLVADMALAVPYEHLGPDEQAAFDDVKARWLT